MMSHYVETNSKLELTDVGSSDPRLGSLLILNVSVLPSGLSTEDSMPPYRSGSCDSWNEFCPDLRPGDLVAIKSGHLGERSDSPLLRLKNFSGLALVSY